MRFGKWFGVVFGVVAATVWATAVAILTVKAAGFAIGTVVHAMIG